MDTEQITTEELQSEIELADNLFGHLIEDSGEEPEQPDIDEEEVDIVDGDEDEDDEDATEENVEDSDEEQSDEDTEYEYAEPDHAVKVTVDGEENVVTVEELKSGYLRQSDYTRKTQELSNRSLDLDKREVELAKSFELAKLETEMLMEQSADVDWDSLSPEEYKAAMQQRQRLQSKLSGITDKLNEYKSRIDTEKQDNQQDKAKQAIAVLEREVPGYNDELYGLALEYAVVQLGVPTEVAMNLTDPGIIRSFILAYQNEGLSPKPKETKQGMPKKGIKKLNKQKTQEYAADDARAWEAFV